MHSYSKFILNKSNNFSLIRHIAALFVLISHSYDLLGKSGEEPLSILSNNFFSFSRIGLIVFFFISGFLVTQSLVTSKNIVHFLWKRILRIYPALIILIILTVFVLGTLFTTFPLSVYFASSQTWQYFVGGISLIKLRFYLPGVFNGEGVNGSLWSLPIEFRLYLMLVLVYFIAGFKRDILISLVIILIVFLFFVGVQKYLSVPKWLGIYIYWGLYFFTGSLVYFLKNKIKLNFLIFFCFVIFYFFPGKLAILGRLSELLIICYGCLLVGFRIPSFKSLFFSENDYSYSIYIYAYPIQQAIIYVSGRDNISPVCLMFLTIIILIPFCWMSWNYIEKPALRMKDIFLKKSDSIPKRL
ncbi:MAG: acyltransferase [Agriterribacter sp.]